MWAVGSGAANSKRADGAFTVQERKWLRKSGWREGRSGAR